MNFTDYGLYLEGYDPFTAAWYREWKVRHLAKYPAIADDPVTISNIDEAIARAEKREQADGSCAAVHTFGDTQ